MLTAKNRTTARIYIIAKAISGTWCDHLYHVINHKKREIGYNIPRFGNLDLEKRGDMASREYYSIMWIMPNKSCINSGNCRNRQVNWRDKQEEDKMTFVMQSNTLVYP